MIGNDIVDLHAARIESNWQRKGYLRKIFTEAEQLSILSSANPEIMLWCLWSMKEAAYKIHNRKTRIRSYMPLKLSCYDIEVTKEGLSGKIRCMGETYFTKTTVTGDYIHTVAVTKKDVFGQLTCRLSGYKEYIGWQDQVGKDEYGQPFISNNGERFPVSISHHGKFYSRVFPATLSPAWILA